MNWQNIKNLTDDIWDGLEDVLLYNDCHGSELMHRGAFDIYRMSTTADEVINLHPWTHFAIIEPPTKNQE